MSLLKTSNMFTIVSGVIQPTLDNGQINEKDSAGFILSYNNVLSNLLVWPVALLLARQKRVVFQHSQLKHLKRPEM